MAKPRKKMRRSYHVFKRRLPDGEIFKKKCIEKPGTGIVTLFVTVSNIDAALRADGQADSQNCAGAFCTRAHRHRFNHSVGFLVDWWRSRVYIDEGNEKGVPRCRVYAHYDKIEGLFDTDKGLKRLRQLVEKAGSKGMEVTLYPVKSGRHPRTGKPSKPSGVSSGPSGEKRRVIGSELRLMNYIRAREEQKQAGGGNANT